MPLDLPPKAELWLPPKPAIIRAWQREDAQRATFPMPLFVPVAGKQLTFIDSAWSNANTNVFDFTSKSFGVARADRYIIVGVSGANNSVGITSIVIGGVTATLLEDINVGESSGNVTAMLAIAAVPTGATGTIQVNWSGTEDVCGIGWWRAVGLTSATPHDLLSNTSNPATGSLDTLSGGFIVAFVSYRNAVTTTWTNLTERFDRQDGIDPLSGADARTNGSSVTITATPSGALSGGPSLVAGSW
jgi:hypothetical protein